MDTDYERELRHIFTYNAVVGDNGQEMTLDVTKINLIYDIDYIIELEEKLDKGVEKK